MEMEPDTELPKLSVARVMWNSMPDLKTPSTHGFMQAVPITLYIAKLYLQKF